MSTKIINDVSTQLNLALSSLSKFQGKNLSPSSTRELVRSIGDPLRSAMDAALEGVKTLNTADQDRVYNAVSHLNHVSGYFLNGLVDYADKGGAPIQYVEEAVTQIGNSVVMVLTTANDVNLSKTLFDRVSYGAAQVASVFNNVYTSVVSTAAGTVEFTKKLSGWTINFLQWGVAAGGLFMLYWYVLRPADKRKALQG